MSASYRQEGGPALSSLPLLLLTVSLHDMPRNRQYSMTPSIRMLVIRNTNYPDGFGPSGTHFLTVILLHIFMV